MADDTDRLQSRQINALERTVNALFVALAPIQALLIGEDNTVREEVKKLLTNPATYIVTTVAGFIFSTIIRPPFEALLAAGQASVRAIQALFGALVGALVSVSALLVNEARPLAIDVLAIFQAFNQASARLVAAAGLGAFPVATALWLVEAVVVSYGTFWLIWTVIRVIDIPFINLGPLLRVATKPVRAVVGVFR